MYCLSWNMLSPIERPTRNTIGSLANGVKHFFRLTATIWTSDVFQQERAVALLCYRHLMSIALGSPYSDSTRGYSRSVCPLCVAVCVLLSSAGYWRPFLAGVPSSLDTSI